jgi:hypothetical protein
VMVSGHWIGGSLSRLAGWRVRPMHREQPWRPRCRPACVNPLVRSPLSTSVLGREMPLRNASAMDPSLPRGCHSQVGPLPVSRRPVRCAR